MCLCVSGQGWCVSSCMCFYELACLRAREHPFPLKIESAAALALAATIAGAGTFVIAPSSAAGGGDGVADRVYQAEEERPGRKRRSRGPRSSSRSHITKPVSTAQRGTRNTGEQMDGRGSETSQKCMKETYMQTDPQADHQRLLTSSPGRNKRARGRYVLGSKVSEKFV